MAQGIVEIVDPAAKSELAIRACLTVELPGGVDGGVEGEEAESEIGESTGGTLQQFGIMSAQSSGVDRHDLGQGSLARVGDGNQ